MNLKNLEKNERTEKKEYGLENGFCNDQTKGILTDLRLTDKEAFQKFIRINKKTFPVKLSNIFLG